MMTMITIIIKNNNNNNLNRKHLVNENKGKEDTLRKLEGFEVINFTINRQNVDYESNAPATTNTIEPEKTDMVKHQSNCMNSITRFKLNKLELQIN